MNGNYGNIKTEHLNSSIFWKLKSRQDISVCVQGSGKSKNSANTWLKLAEDKQWVCKSNLG